MAIWAGVGSSASKNSREAGREAARAALGGHTEASLVLVFATAGHDQAGLLAGVASVIGSAPMSGCSGAGVIGQDGSSEASHAVRVMAIGGAGLAVATAQALDVSRDAAAAARALVAALAPHAPRAVLLFPDGLTVDSTALLAELERGLPGVPLLGGAAGEMHEFVRTFQYHAGVVSSDSVSAVALGGAIDVEFAVTHGCDLLGIEHEITRAEGPMVFELDGRPAWAVLREYLDEPGDDLDAKGVPYLCVAQPVPGGDDVVIRVPLRLDKPTGALFIPGGLRTGQRVTMAHRQRDLIASRAVAAAAAVRQRAGRPPAFVLQFDCTGRGSLMYGDRVTAELIEPVQRVFGREVPWIGFHSYGEIAPLGGTAMYHNYSMALCAVVERHG